MSGKAPLNKIYYYYLEIKNDYEDYFRKLSVLNFSHIPALLYLHFNKCTVNTNPLLLFHVKLTVI